MKGRRSRSKFRDVNYVRTQVTISSFTSAVSEAVKKSITFDDCFRADLPRRIIRSEKQVDSEFLNAVV